MDAQSSNYETKRFRHYVDSFAHPCIDVGHQDIILLHTAVERPMNNRVLDFPLYERALIV